MTENTHCSQGARGVTGADIVRISRTLALEPWHFTQTGPSAANDPAGILLDEGRRRVTLGLATAAHGCVFLVRTLGGKQKCGLGDLAPASCRNGVDKDDRRHWLETVRRWNAKHATEAHTIEDFQRYLLEAQCARDAGAPWPEEVSA